MSHPHNKTPSEIAQIIVGLHLKGLSSPDIGKLLSKVAPANRPADRTIRNIIKQQAPAQPSKPCQTPLTDSKPKGSLLARLEAKREEHEAANPAPPIDQPLSGKQEADNGKQPEPPSDTPKHAQQPAQEAGEAPDTDHAQAPYPHSHETSDAGKIAKLKAELDTLIHQAASPHEPPELIEGQRQTGRRFGGTHRYGWDAGARATNSTSPVREQVQPYVYELYRKHVR